MDSQCRDTFKYNLYNQEVNVKKIINQMISDFGIGGDEQKTGMKENRE